MITEWEGVIGLEVHIQLLTKSKLFSRTATRYGAAPNTQAGIVDLGMPGTLPVLNEEAVKMAIKFGLSIQAQIASEAVFARKHYFYPDNPKGYQISQHEQPIVGAGGYLTIEGDRGMLKRIPITRAHLEEDAGKSLHEGFQGMGSGIDLNRAGVPLLEIVSDPVLSSAVEAVSYLKTLHTLVRYLEICDGNMQEGSFRCDANVSVRKSGSEMMGVRSEIKNLNSFRFVEKAIQVEIERQIAALEAGEILSQETRSYDVTLNQTRTLRAKENVADYRYFPDPDLCPLLISPEFIQGIAQSLPELPDVKRVRFQEEYQLSAYDAGVLITSRDLADYFESVVKQHVPFKLAANWINGELAAALNQASLDIHEVPVSAERFSGLLRRIEDGTLSGSMAKVVFEKLWITTESADDIIAREGLQQMTDLKAIEALVDEVLCAYPKQWAAYQAGKEKLFGFFVGQTMQRSQGKCHPARLNEVLKRKLGQSFVE